MSHGSGQALTSEPGLLLGSAQCRPTHASTSLWACVDRATVARRHFLAPLGVRHGALATYLEQVAVFCAGGGFGPPELPSV
eukprot:13795533-Alexandrium_andersonii.AAC.1